SVVGVEKTRQSKTTVTKRGSQAKSTASRAVAKRIGVHLSVLIIASSSPLDFRMSVSCRDRSQARRIRRPRLLRGDERLRASIERGAGSAGVTEEADWIALVARCAFAIVIEVGHAGFTEEAADAERDVVGSRNEAGANTCSARQECLSHRRPLRLRPGSR